MEKISKSELSNFKFVASGSVSTVENLKRTIEKLSDAISAGLPGEKAQFLMAPSNRSSRSVSTTEELNPRLAAVLILIYPIDDFPHVVFTKRRVYEGVHSGQVSLPGGGVEENDKSLVHTALRETEEELNIGSSSINIMGTLSELYIPPSNYIVTPVISYSLERLNFIPDSREVDYVLEVPLPSLLSAKPVQSRINISETQHRIVPAYNLKGHIVWGATAMILSEFVELMLSV